VIKPRKKTLTAVTEFVQPAKKSQLEVGKVRRCFPKSEYPTTHVLQLRRTNRMILLQIDIRV
jgi:hypothetical protein